MKKKLAATLSVVLILGLAVLGILAYLTSEDSDVNVMTLGNVKIEQIEQEWNADGTELVDFTQAKPLYPYVGEFGWNLNDDEAYRQFTMNNVVDKYVSVKNTGKSDAYVRTIIALEMGSLTEEEFNQVGVSINMIDGAEFDFPGTWQWNDGFVGEIDGHNYYVIVAVHENALKPGETTIPSLLQVYLSKDATNEDVKALDGNGNGTYDILVKSEAVQAAGFEGNPDLRDGMSAAEYALNTAFYEVSEATVAEVYEDVVIPDAVIGSYEELKAVKDDNGNYVLSGNVNSTNIIHFGNGTDVTLDLNGKTITAEKTDQFALGAQQGSKLHLTGDGTVNMGKGFMANKGDAEIIIDGGTYNATVTSTLNGMKFTSFAQNNSKIVINGGKFTTNVDNAALFFATSNARIEINGGFFENTVDKTPDLLSMGINKSNTNRIVITGGTFVNYNPLEDRMCYTGEWPENGEEAFSGPWMLIPGDYKVVSETQANGDVWYSVVPK